MCARPDCAPEPYLVQHADLTLSMVISEWTVWLPLLLAMVLPIVMHVQRRDRFGGPFSTSEVAETPHPASYRRAAPRVVGADARRLRILIHGFGVRVSVAMLLTLVPCLQLVGARFVKNYGCVSYTNVFSVPEYLTYVLLLLVVVLVHAPSERRVFGSASRSAV